METVLLKPLLHRGRQCIGIYYPPNDKLNQYIQKKAGASWSRTHKCWYLPNKKESYIKIKQAVQGTGILDTSALKQYLVLQKKKAPQQPVAVKSVVPPKKMPVALPPPKSPVWLSEENAGALHLFKQQLQLKAYSASTIRTYTNELQQFFYTIKHKPASQFTTTRLKDYLQYCYVTLKLSEATLHSRINALKFYYEQVLHKEKFFWEIPRPKKHDQLPKVLSEEEIGRMFNAIGNLKHKAILFTAYSAGLRVSEVINLKIRDVDSGRMQLLIEKSKGKKDRYVGLSILLLDVLRAYLQTCKPMPKKYVFENPLRAGEAYSVRSAQKIFEVAKEKAFVTKRVGIHSLRHSFATHLLEKGIDIRYIKDLLGHFSIKTTERYLHVKKETLINIPNVLDELNKTFTLEW